MTFVETGYSSRAGGALGASPRMRKLAVARGFDTATSATAVGGGLWVGTTRGQAVMTTADCPPGGG